MKLSQRYSPADAERAFWLKVTKTESCWEWTGSKLKDGYGMLRIGGRDVMAHRYSWELANGPIPNKMVIDHKCWTHSCVNPDHLRLATSSQNTAYLSRISSRNKSGYRGIFWVENRNEWVAQVGQTLGSGRKKYHTKYFAPQKLEEAARWVKAKREEVFGEFAGVA